MFFFFWLSVNLPFTQTLDGSIVNTSLHDCCSTCDAEKQTQPEAQVITLTVYHNIYTVCVNTFPYNCTWPDLTLLTMSLRAWKPDRTGKTCSVPSAISASWDQNRRKKSWSLNKIFYSFSPFFLLYVKNYEFMCYCFLGRSLACDDLQQHLGRVSLFLGDKILRQLATAFIYSFNDARRGSLSGII